MVSHIHLIAFTSYKLIIVNYLTFIFNHLRNKFPPLHPNPSLPIDKPWYTIK